MDAFRVPLDVRSDESATAAAKMFENEIGRLDVLVDNAGVTGGMPQAPGS